MTIRMTEVGKLDFSDIGTDRIEPVTPGEVLLHEFMKPLDLSSHALAREIGVPANRISEIVAGRRAITAETAIKLGDYFGMSAEFWMKLQMIYELQQYRAMA